MRAQDDQNGKIIYKDRRQRQEESETDRKLPWMVVAVQKQATKSPYLRDKMVVSFLLLFTPLCAVVYHDIENFYQAEEDDSVTLEWIFPSMANVPFTSLHIFCHLTDNKASALFDLRGGIEVPEDEQFVGRVHCEKEALREGQIRLHVSRLRPDDSGLYVCGVLTKNGIEFNKCFLNVTAVRRPEPLTWEPEVKGTVNCYCGFGLTALLLYWFFLCTLFFM